MIIGLNSVGGRGGGAGYNENEQRQIGISRDNSKTYLSAGMVKSLANKNRCRYKPPTLVGLPVYIS